MSNKNKILKKLKLLRLLREKNQKCIDSYRLLDGLFDKQIALIKDPHKRKAAVCTRRAGKTFSVARDLVLEALLTGADSLYVAPSGKHARSLMWRPLKKLLESKNIPHTKNESMLEIKLDNGAMIYLAGADKEDSIERFRGFFFGLVVLDESGSFRSHIVRLIREVIQPALTDVDGTLLLVGTPNSSCAGYFYEATSPKGIYSSQFSVHQWSVVDNSMFPRWRGRSDWRELAAKFLEQVRIEDNYEEEDPAYQREWLGRWVRSDEAFVFKYNRDINSYVELPDMDGWQHVISIDLGFDDAFGVVVLAFHEDLSSVYEVDRYKKSKLIPEQWAEIIQKYDDKYKPVAKVADSGALGKAIVTEFNKRYGLGIKAAEKSNKWDYIELVNGDFRGKKLYLELGKETEEEVMSLRKEPDRLKENDEDDNHLTDCLLYGWRECQHWIRKEVDDKPAKNTLEYEENVMLRQAEQELEEQEDIEDWL